jgi:formylglycine-generating enzyme required for sulfatase activity
VPQAVNRFLRELQASVQVQSEHVDHDEDPRKPREPQREESARAGRFREHEVPPPRVLRGGSFVNYASYPLAAYRDDYTPSSRHYVIGARCARSAP